MRQFSIRSRDGWLYLMLLPGLLFFILFKYLPMWGVLISLQNYQPALGLWGSEWVGLAHYKRFFSDPSFWMLFRNTTLLAVYSIVIFFPMPIIVALLLNELRVQWFKRSIQTLIYIPHFFSIVVVVAISYVLFTTEGGIINEMIVGIGGEKVNFLTEPEWFRPMVTLQVVWKETGFGTIIFLAALAGVDPQLYEAAKIDGANRWHQLCHITLPAIRSTIVILLILRLGHFLDTGFEQMLLMINALNRDVGEVFDTYVYTSGILEGQFSYSTTVGLFKSIVGLVLVVIANRIARKLGEEGVY
ncbi:MULTISPECIES: ABC transporter permease [Paenibacillus]|jgi:putative aldouronate transport system permease protein|uniref:ABC transporter permease subunit n=1 Tax=Paenibacillus baimaensis TaxID=2982185 RepID=A0ABT2UQ72_9BACL|nr:MULTISPECIES: ABC transporter permease subunit [Paenibacillus]MCU6795987.1 ABC transporter permease subunit [Paenibacillus sp. WQ 127069]OMF20786.1 protein lplB [Paenibacillus sp. FSL H7-0331]